MRRPLICLLTLLICLSPAWAAQVRIKDIARVEGVRENYLVGYGLVMGLPGTGDSMRNSPFTEQSLKGMLERLGVSVRDDQLRTQNVAAVIVTATLPPFSRQGSLIDVNVSTLGDASNLQGGTLLPTPLIGADGEVYAVAAGTMVTSSVSAQGDGASIVKGVPTAARVPNGATVEREINFRFDDQRQLKLALMNPDFTTAMRMVDSIQAVVGEDLVKASDPGTVVVQVPPEFLNNVTAFVASIENLTVEPDQVARVVVDESSGVIVMGDNVRISTVAIAQGNLTVRITETPQVSQPNPLAEGETVVVPRTDIQVDEQSDRKIAVLPSGVTLRELVEGLNALGVGPRDVISILQSIKAAGALQADIEVL